MEIFGQGGASGVLYRPVYEGRIDTWSYSEYVLDADDSGRASELWSSGTRSEWDRDLVEPALESLKINGEPVVMAVDFAELLDLIDDLEVHDS